jgi:hypothetical protein
MSYANTSSDSEHLIAIPAEKRAVSAPRESSSMEPAIEGKWSRSSTLLFILVFCGLSWAAVIAAAFLSH